MKKTNAMVRQLGNNKGFTLIEMAIVLVIIGLLIGGVLKGQELIDGTKVKRAIADMDGMSAAYNGYIDRYRAIPGDDGIIVPLQARGGIWAAAATPTLTAGNANGVLAITPAQTFVPTAAEGIPFWQHLRASGFISGDANIIDPATILPQNPFNGLMGVSVGTGGTLTGMPPNGLSVCLSHIPGKAAAQIDRQLDNGVSNTGTVRATAVTAGATPALSLPAAAPTDGFYDETLEYTVCKSM